LFGRSGDRPSPNEPSPAPTVGRAQGANGRSSIEGNSQQADPAAKRYKTSEDYKRLYGEHRAQALVLTVGEIHTAYRENQAAAVERWQGKLLEVQGTVRNVIDSILVSIRIEDAEGRGIDVLLLPSEKPAAMRFRPGDPIRVLGIGKDQGYVAGALMNCMLVPVKAE